MPEMPKKNWGHHARFGDKLCGRPIVAVVQFIYFWRKVKAIPPLEGRHCD